MRKLLIFIGCLALWLFSLRWFVTPNRPELINGLVERQRIFIQQPTSAEAALLNANNPEWTLMGRTFSVLAFTNLALSQPERRSDHLALADALINQTLKTDAHQGQLAFMLPYGRVGEFINPTGRSLFVDGELALMLAARLTVEPNPRFATELRRRIDFVTSELNQAPNHLAESYPDEGWVFCNAIALAALKLADHIDGRDHSQLIATALTSLKTRFIEPKSGLLISSFHADGTMRDGPEGSTLWLAVNMIQVIDPAFAQQQYASARKQLGHTLFGFAWASEWPKVLGAREDIDSGPTIPLLDANAGSSGTAFMAAASFGDDAFLSGLLRSVWFAGFPTTDHGALHFAAGNQLGDAVLLYSLVQGPLFETLTREPRS